MKKLKLKKNVLASLNQEELSKIVGGDVFSNPCNTTVTISQNTCPPTNLSDNPHQSCGACGPTYSWNQLDACYTIPATCLNCNSAGATISFYHQNAC